MERLAELDVDELIGFDEAFRHWMTDPGTPEAARSLFAALHTALRGESRRRRGTGEAYRLDTLREVVEGIPSRDLDEGIPTFAAVLGRGAEVGLLPPTLLVYEAVQRLLIAERLDRQAVDRRMRRAISDAIPGGWGDRSRDVGGAL
jgi:uncharacterized protein with von Willebrand factor type A (vWA) domain